MHWQQEDSVMMLQEGKCQLNKRVHSSQHRRTALVRELTLHLKSSEPPSLLQLPLHSHIQDHGDGQAHGCDPQGPAVEDKKGQELRKPSLLCLTTLSSSGCLHMNLKLLLEGVSSFCTLYTCSKDKRLTVLFLLDEHIQQRISQNL